MDGVAFNRRRPRHTHRIYAIFLLFIFFFSKISAFFFFLLQFSAFSKTISPNEVAGLDLSANAGGKFYSPAIPSQSLSGGFRVRAHCSTTIFTASPTLLHPFLRYFLVQIPAICSVSSLGSSSLLKISSPITDLCLSFASPRTPKHNLDDCKSFSDLIVLCFYRPEDLELHRFLYSCLAGPAGFRFEAKECLKFDSNPRSKPFSCLRLRFAHVSDRLCSSLGKSEKSTNSFIPFPSPLVGRARSSYSFNSTGDCKLSRRSSRHDRYNLPTPIVLNLNSKFIVDIGVLHGFNSVMEKDYLSADIYIRRVALRCECFYQRICALILIGRFYRRCHKYYRLRAALFTGPSVSVVILSIALKGDPLALLSHDVATNFIDSVESINAPESYRRKDVLQAAAGSLRSELGHHPCFMGLGPNFVTFWLTFRTGHEPTSRFSHKDHNKKLLGSKIIKFGLLLALKLYSENFMDLGYGSESLMTHVIGFCNELNVLAFGQLCNCTLSV